MKRLLCILLCLITALCALGCQSGSGETVRFYYCRNDYVYGAENGVIRPETRSTEGHTAQLSYLLSLYLMGPMDESLSSPLPADTRLLSAQVQDGSLEVVLSELPADMTEANISLAFSCLALTCLDITGQEQITITAGSRSITLDRDSIVLYDDATIPPNTEETK